jgi:hypothetical protein
MARITESLRRCFDSDDHIHGFFIGLLDRWSESMTHCIRKIDLPSHWLAAERRPFNDRLLLLLRRRRLPLVERARRWRSGEPASPAAVPPLRSQFACFASARQLRHSRARLFPHISPGPPRAGRGAARGAASGRLQQEPRGSRYRSRASLREPPPRGTIAAATCGWSSARGRSCSRRAA